MKKKRPFDVQLCVMCEDVREEKNGKHSLIGVYSGDILISELPGDISMAFFIEIIIREVGLHELQLRLSGPGAHSATLKAQVDLTEKNAVSVLKTPRIQAGLEEPGTFRFDISTDGETWENLITKQISLMPSSATASPPPSERSPSAARASS